MDLKFRNLRADEIDVRVSTCSEKGVSLLLYKDARCDMNILDETVGAFNWKREHCRDNANCIVSIWDNEKSQWISKEDTGTESFTEKEKGLASDSFKRACFNWGIGRELYTAPFIWVNAADVNITQKNNKYTTYDRFSVDKITVKDGIIQNVVIKNEKSKKQVYPNGQSAEQKKDKQVKKDKAQPPQENASKDCYICRQCGTVVYGTKTRSAEQLKQSCVEKYGQILCPGCAKEISNDENADNQNQQG